MELGQHYQPSDDPPPPPPPPKMNLYSPSPSPGLPPTLGYFSRSPSQSPSRHLDNGGPLSPPFNRSFDGLLTPTSPNHISESLNAPPSPVNSTSKAKQGKKSNPLTDLVDSEREYIELLAGIIRKVAGAWSRTNFPPKQLDAVFRGIEVVYKANRGLLTRLKEIGPAPTSPKALGDLLMRWIDDLDAPYTRFCSSYAAGFDTWDPIVSNTRLPPILAELSSVHPPTSTLLHTNVEHGSSPMWTLDTLFALPRARLKYYKKLYTRLLKSTQPGRSDHKLLTAAVEKLETLLGILADKEGLVVGQELKEGLNTAISPLTGPEVSTLDTHITDKGYPSVSGSETTDDQVRESVGSSVPPSSISSEPRDFRDIASSDGGARVASSATMSMPIANLESRLCTDRVIDIFNLKPRPTRLQMNPPSLPFTRSLRVSLDVEVHFTPQIAPDSPRVHTNGHVFLTTDLFLVCERMSAEERQAVNSGPNGQDYDMWLLYPPLAGRHLVVSECLDQDNVLQVRVLKKETIFLHAESKAARDSLRQGLQECVEAANLLSPRTGQPPPPPVPSLKTLPRSPTDMRPQNGEPRLISPAEMSSAASPMSASISNSSPQPKDQNRSSGDQGYPTRHNFPNNPPNFTHRSNPEPGAMDTRSGGMPLQSASQPQLHLSASSGSSNQSQLTNLIPPSASAPILPPPRGASNPQHNADGRMSSPARPATAPGRPHYMAPSMQPQYITPGMQYPGSVQPNHVMNEQSVRGERPPSDPMLAAPLRKSPSALSLGSPRHQQNSLPSIPGHPGTHHHAHHSGGYPPRDGSVNYASVPHVHQPHPRVPFPPSTAFNPRAASFATTSSWTPSREPSPPSSPVDDDPVPVGPVTSAITAQFKCKVFLQLHHGQWKSLGGARLKLYLQHPTNIKQLVVEAESKDKAMLISTIVLTDGVERVGKTGVAIELSDKGARTGIVYMIQLRNEVSASGLFDSLLAGSDRAAGRTGKG